MRRVTIHAADPAGRPAIFRFEVPRGVSVLEALLPRCGPHGQPLAGADPEPYIVVRTGRPFHVRWWWRWKRRRSGLHTIKHADGITEIRFYKHSASLQHILNALARQGLFRLKVVTTGHRTPPPRSRGEFFRSVLAAVRDWPAIPIGRPRFETRAEPPQAECR